MLTPVLDTLLTCEWHNNVYHARKIRAHFIKFVLRFPCTLHSTRAAAWLGFAANKRTPLFTALNGYSMWNRTKNTLLMRQSLRNRSSLELDVFSYIDIIYPMVCFLKIWQIPPWNPLYTYLLTPRSRVLLEKLTSKLCS